MLKNLVIKFFAWYIETALKREFSSFSYNSLQSDPSRSILLLSNHFSWWDGFMMYQINKEIFKKKFHVMVTEENYRKVFFLKYLGAFPVKKGSRNIIESLEHAGKLLNDAQNLVLIFPQGKLCSNHVQEIDFEKGLIHLINSSDKKFQYLFSSTFVDYYEKRKPSATCYLTNWEGPEFAGLPLIKAAYNNHYENSRQKQCRITV